MARRKITDDYGEQAALAELAGELPELTPSQHAYVQGLLAGKSGADAYRCAYNAQNMSAPAVSVEASRLMANPKIALWLSAARQAHLGNGVVTLESHIRELERLKELALAAGNLGAAVQAEQLRGKAMGHYVEQVADVTIDPSRTLNEIAAHSPELAAALAREHGLTLETKH